MTRESQREAPGGPRRLAVVYDEIGARARAITETRPWWPCKRGCDACCRSLAEPPAVSRAEWEHLWEGFLALDPAVRAAIRARVEALAHAQGGEAPPPEVTCPFLDRTAGECLVYPHRPAACRTYGFYVTRAHGNWCETILGEVVAREDLVTWGNQLAVDEVLARLSGPPISIVEWFASHP